MILRDDVRFDGRLVGDRLAFLCGEIIFKMIVSLKITPIVEP